MADESTGATTTETMTANNAATGANNAAVEGGATAATTTGGGATTTGVTMPEQLIGGETTGTNAAVEGGATEGAKTGEAAEPKYDKDGFELDADGKQKLDSQGKPIPKPAEGKAPAEYAEFKIPEGTTLDATTATEFKAMAKELDLTQEQAQKLLDFGGGKLRALAEGPYKAWSEMQTKWQAEVKADPEIGGTNFEASRKSAALVFVPGESNPFVGSAAEAQSLKEALNTTGAGNNPAIVKMFVRMGRMLAEPGSLTGKPPNANTLEAKLDKMYPTMSEGQASQ
jgi:hypothetical protein